MDVIKRIFSIVILLCAIAAHYAGFSQVHKLNASDHFFISGNISLDSLTRMIHRQSNYRFSFNSVKVNGSKDIYFAPNEYSIPQILSQIKKTTSLYYSFFNGYIIFQDNPPKALLNNETEINKNKKIISDETEARQHTHTEINNGKKNQSQLQPGKMPIKTHSINADYNKKYYDELSYKIKIIETKPLNVRQSATLKSNETTLNKSSREKRTIRIPISLSGGLQWNFTIPFYATNDYFVTTKDIDQPYIYLVPGIWISNKFNNKNELLFLVKPGEHFYTPNKTLAVSTFHDSINVSGTNIKSLLKTELLSAELSYIYNINTKFSIGAGVLYNWQFAALINKEKIFDSTHIHIDSLYSIKSRDNDWQYIKPGVISAKADFAYTFHSWQVGADVLIPVTKITTVSENEKTFLSGQLFFRWIIF